MREQQSILLDATKMVTIRIVDFSFIQHKLYPTMEHAKNSFCFCLKKLNYLSITYKSFTGTSAVTPVCTIFQVFPDEQKSCNQ